MIHIKKLKIALLTAVCLTLCSFDADKFDAAVEKGYAAEDAGNYEKAISIYKELLPTVPSDSISIISDLYSSLLHCNLRIGQLHSALDYGEKGLALDEKAGDKERIASSLSNIASILVSARRIEKAEDYLLRSISIERELKRDDKLAIRLGLLSELYLSRQQPEKALPPAKEALELDQQGGREMKAAIRMSQLGNVLLHMHRCNDAMPYLTEALKLHRKHKNMASEALTLVALGQAEHELGQLSQATAHLKECVRLSKEYGLLNPQITAHNELARIYKKMNMPEAYDHLLLYTELKDSLNTHEVQQQISDLEVKYDTYQKEQELLKKEMVINEQRMIYIGLAVMLVLTIAAVFFLMRMLYLKNQNIKLRNNFMQIISHDLKNPALAQQKNLHILSKSIGVIDKEDLQRMAQQMAEDADIHVNLLYSLLDWTQLQTGRLRFTPIDMDMEGVTKEVVSQLRVQAEVKNVTIETKAEGDATIIRADRQMVQSIVRNILSNAIKFSDKGGGVTISINSDSLTIDDNGIGFGEPSSEKGTGIGLKLVEKLAEINGFSFEISRKSDRGTLAVLKFNKK